MEDIDVKDLPYKQLSNTLMKLKQKLDESSHIREANDFYELFQKAKEEINERHQNLFKKINIYELLKSIEEVLSETHEEEKEAIEESIQLLNKRAE